jgi:hypothetical protein
MLEVNTPLSYRELQAGLWELLVQVLLPLFFCVLFKLL